MNLKSLYSSVVLLLLLFAFAVQPAATQDVAVGYNWWYAGFDDRSTSFNPQNVLNKNNVDQLRQEWMTSLSKAPFMFGNETARTTSSALSVYGFVYFIDRAQVLLALNAENNQVLWYKTLSVSDPKLYGVEDEDVHTRLINYFDRKIWLIDLDCSIKGYNYYNGDIEVDIPPQVLCGTISPDAEPRETLFRAVSAPVFYEKQRIIIAAPSGFEARDRSLSYVTGLSLESKNIVWKTPLTTDNGGNVNIGVGQWAVDQEAGVVYIGTGSPIPEWNATRRLGANLYSDSIISLDASTGKILWSYQTVSHDLNGYGCTGNVLLGESGGKKTVYAACRNGYLYALDAKTGSLLWYFDPPAVKRLNSGNGDLVKTGRSDTQKPWLNYPSKEPVVQCPGVSGAVSSNIALGYNTIYLSTFNSCSQVTVAPVKEIGDTGVANITALYSPVGAVNSTLYAVDASTGKEKWSQFFDGVANKGGITVSGGLTYLPSADGSLYAFDAATGAKTWSRLFGTLGLAIPPVIAATAKGNWTLIQIVSGTPLLGLSDDLRSGFLFMFTLPSDAATTTAIVGDQTPPTEYSVTVYTAVAAAIVLLVAAFSVYYVRKRRHAR